MSTAMVSQTYLADEREELAQVHSFIEAHAKRQGVAPPARFMLVGAGEGEQIELPESLYGILVQVVDALASGKAVTVTPQEPQLTTQQAADLLGVSRPTLMKMIEEGTIAAHKVGTHHRLRACDVFDALRARRARERAAFAKLLELEGDED